jgi:hypothetical protein
MWEIGPAEALHRYFAGPMFLNGSSDFLQSERPVKRQNDSADA